MATKKKEVAAPLLSSTTLEQLTSLAHRLLRAILAVEKAEDALKEAKKLQRALEEEDLPEMLAEIGLSEVTLTSGEKITVKPDVYCSIPDARKEEAFTWLTDNGFGGMIKTEISIQFDKEREAEARKFFKELISKGREPSMTQGVHAGTLKAWLNEQIEKAATVPLDLFGARRVKKAKVKVPKVKD